MLAEFVLIVALEGHNEYVGNFIDCAHAFQHAKIEYHEYNHMCLHEDYVFFPTEQPKIYYYPGTKD
jgi:hypothetical protein